MGKMTEIRKRDQESGRLSLRDGVTVVLFLPTPMDQAAGPILAAFNEYLAMIPSGVLRWGAVGASTSSWKAVAKNTFDRCRAQLKREAVRKRRLTAFDLVDGETGGDAPGYGVKVLGNQGDPDFPLEKCLFRVCFPTEVLEDVELFVRHVKQLAAGLPFVSGYASPALQWAELDQDEALKQARALTRRYPGYDIERNQSGRIRIGTKVRGRGGSRSSGRTW